MWNGWYTQIPDFKDMYHSAQVAQTAQSKTFMGMALICEVWAFSLLTDTYGDVPYSEAIQARDGILRPKFDRQEDIYQDLFKKLEEANELLKANTNLAADQTVQCNACHVQPPACNVANRALSPSAVCSPTSRARSLPWASIR